MAATAASGAKALASDSPEWAALRQHVAAIDKTCVGRRLPLRAPRAAWRAVATAAAAPTAAAVPQRPPAAARQPPRSCSRAAGQGHGHDHKPIGGTSCLGATQRRGRSGSAATPRAPRCAARQAGVRALPRTSPPPPCLIALLPLPRSHLRDLLSDAARCEALIREEQGLYMDFSRQRMTPETLKVCAHLRSGARLAARCACGLPSREGRSQAHWQHMGVHDARDAQGGYGLHVCDLGVLFAAGSSLSERGERGHSDSMVVYLVPGWMQRKWRWAAGSWCAAFGGLVEGRGRARQHQPSAYLLSVVW